jgi:tetratricopeptide (TPR) repeat protein
MRGRTCIISLFLCLLSQISLGNSSLPARADSLRRILYRTDDPKEKIRLYLQLSLLFENEQPDSSIVYLDPARTLAKQIEDPKLTAEVYYSLGNVAVMRNQLDLAFNNFKVAAILFRKAGDTLGYARMLMLQGNITAVREDAATAMGYFMESIDLAEKYGYNNILSHLYNNVGTIYMQSNDRKKALTYFTLALKTFIKNGDSANLGTALLNIGSAYREMGNSAMAASYINRAYIIFQKEKDDFSIANCMMTLGVIENLKGNCREAERFFGQSLLLVSQAGGGYRGPTNVLRSEILVRRGINHLCLGNQEEALRFLSEGYRLARSMKQPGMIILAAENLSKVYEKMNNEREALYYYKTFKQESDSLARVITVRSVELTEVRQEYLKKQKENELRILFERTGKERVIIIYFISGAILLAVIVILFLLLKLEKHKKIQTDLERTVLDEKLEYQTKEITTNVMYINKMNEMVVQVAEKLKSLSIDENSDNAQVVRSIIKELGQNSQNDPLKEFEVRFQKINSAFYKNLTDKYSDLTPNELKLCAFLRLNMSTKEISALTYQTENSIMVARTRLRQKLEITRNENLVTFLSQF